MPNSDAPAVSADDSARPAVDPAKRRRRRWILWPIAGVLVAALVTGGVVYGAIRSADSDGDGLADRVERSGWTTVDGTTTYVTDPHSFDTDGDGLSDGDEAGSVVSEPDGETVYTGISDPTKADSDEDGLSDSTEVRGWATVRGAVFHTNPMVADTDGDGLTDGDEAESVVSKADSETVYAGASDPTKADSDGDGLSDSTEVRGWSTVRGAAYHTDPMAADTDGDGLSDADEAGPISEDVDGRTAHAALSNPLLVDTDGDGLSDLDEADFGIDAFRVDTDGDGLDDRLEVLEIGTSPLSTDTDGDGLDDAYEVKNRERDGLDPLFADEQIDPGVWADDFWTGAVKGEFEPRGSVAWLAGNLSAAGTSLIPVVGTPIGTIVDVRDAIGSALHGDWVGTGLSALGLVPVAGDAVSIPAKVGKFVARHPELAAGVAAMVAGLKFIPDHIKLRAIKTTWGKSWDDLVTQGFSTQTLLRLQAGGRNDLHALAAAMNRPGHEPGTPAKFFRNGSAWGRAGEKHLERELKAAGYKTTAQKSVSTKGCSDGCNNNRRRIDVLDVTKGVAHESKVGYKTLTAEIRAQIRSDAWAVKNDRDINSAHWHFYASADTSQLGADPRVLDLLEQFEIKYTIHPPK